jgi:rare lipoprotein A
MKTHRPNPCFPLAATTGPSKFALPLGLALGLALAGCANVNTKTSETDRASVPSQQADASKTVVPPFKGGRYYKDDGPGANPPANLDEIPDAVPKQEPFNRQTSKAYKVMGKRYVPLADNSDYKARGLASWYGRKFHGNTTSIGEPYDMYAMTAAHPTLPLPSYARVTNLENGKSVVVRVNDRGPFHPGRIIDLSYTAAHKLDVLKDVTEVDVAAVQVDAAPTSFAGLAAEEVSFASLQTAVQREPVPAPQTVAEKAEPTRMDTGRGVYLQLGAFGNPVAADGVMARATAKLSSDFPSVMRLESNGLYKVQAGPFANAEAADQAAVLIRNDLGIQAFKVIVATPAPVVAEPAIIQSASGLYLQLAAFSSPVAAEALANRIKLRFGDELPGLDQINVGSLFKLQAGPFASPADAERISLAYFQDFGVKPYRISR